MTALTIATPVSRYSPSHRTARETWPATHDPAEARGPHLSPPAGSCIRLTLMSHPSNAPVTSTRAGTFWSASPDPTNASAEICSVLYESNGQLPGSPCASTVVLSCAGAFPFG